ncbi:hypothetical protein FEM48_Zijuj06G0038000 [Ziziphus jujuba var. spinosa]|uniref:Transmembrane protein n=1 Tax=Ziziphus jujuba var. spinosa TaxID=714518 RepID=A0A978V700_ZIZJJ|nr:hypothetical protein FEM48_Zijuj06G0038000 [Ziziphus jujuba var. spinosa]
MLGPSVIFCLSHAVFVFLVYFPFGSYDLNLKPLICIFITVLVLLSSLISVSEARPLNLNGGTDIFFDGLYIEGIKAGSSGPSPGGKGHSFTNAQTLGGIKNSGPSPGGGGH